MNNWDYPAGADTEDAPWNKVDPEPKKIEVTISLAISKTIEIEVTDYTKTEEKDEEGNVITDYDFSECDLKSAIKNQVILPTEAYDRFHSTIASTYSIEDKILFEDLKGWEINDFEVIKE